MQADEPVKAVAKSAHELSRKRGFEAPFNPTFTGTVSAFLFLSSTFYALYFPCVDRLWALGPTALILTAAGCWLFVVFYNPIDGFCRADTQSPLEGTKYCNHCSCYASDHKRTRHCYDCRKCVPGFDHHCVYLQTCIGKHNYPFFFMLVVSTWMWCATAAGLDIYLAIPASIQVFGQPLNACTLNPKSAPWYTALLAIHALLCVLAFSAVSSLLLFHVIICVKGQTTYEWLVEDMQKKREGVKPFSIVMEERKEQLQKWYADKCAPRPRKPAAAVTYAAAGKGDGAAKGAALKEVQIKIRD